MAADLGVSSAWLSLGVFATGLLLAALLASYIERYLGIETALRESEQRSRRQLLELETLYRTAPIGLALVDRDLRFLRINEKLAEIDGVPISAHIARTLREVLPGVADTIEPLYRRVIESGEAVLHTEVHGSTPAQPAIERDWLLDYYPLKERDGSVQAVGAIVVEITERKRAEEALRLSREFLCHVLDAIDDDVFVKDEQHAWVVLNKSACELIGGSREELIGRSDYDFFLTDQAAQHWQTDDEVLKSRKTIAYEWQSNRKGQCRTFLTKKSLFLDSSTGKKYIAGVAIDITDRKRGEDALRKSEQMLAFGQKIAHLGTFIWHVDTGHEEWSDETFRILGYEPQGVIPTHDAFLNRVHADDRSRVIAIINKALETEQAYDFEFRVVRPNGGGERFVHSQGEVFRSESGRPLKVRGAVLDITDRKRFEVALFNEKERAQVTLHCIGDGVITTDLNCRVEYLNPVAEALTGWTTGEARGKPLETVFNIVEEQSHAPVPNPVARCLNEGTIVGLSGHTVLISRHGQEHAIEDSVAPICGAEGAVLGAVLVFHDVSETRRMARQLQHDAAHDALTGLINRREFEGRLERAVASAKRYGFHHALCYFDLDQFKLVNDTAGHAAGDDLLKHVRGLLFGRLRERDTLARLGGDEFALLLENCGLDEAIRIAEIIVAAFREWRFVWEGRTFHVGASVGVVTIDSGVESAAQLLAQADVACYAAKERGRNRVEVYRKDGAEPSPHHAQILVAATLRDALEQNRFRLFCQPIVELSGDPRSPPRCYELLIRLLDAGGRLILPKAFIPAAERYGLMSAIDRWVIETAFGAYAKGVGASRGADIAINLSGDSLNSHGFLEFVLEQFEKSSVPPHRVCFEITETAAVHNLDHAIEFVTKIKRGGSRVALDDFGSGLSSFTYLRLLPADYLKIDGSFVRDMVNNPQDEALVAAINEVGHILGMTTIAEYAHTAEIVDRLRKLGVDCAQGHAFGTPMPLEDILLDPDSPFGMEAGPPSGRLHKLFH